MFKINKRAFALFVACAMLLSIIGGAVEAAVATLVSPKANEVGGKFVDVTVKFDTQSSKVLVDSATLYIDNAVYTNQKIQSAKIGTVSFDWNTSNFSKGQHFLRVVLFSKGKKVTEVTGYGLVSNSVVDVIPPKVSIANITNNETLTGSKVIRIEAKDDSGEAPIVSLLVDKKLKLMQNTKPYTYNLDTTAMEDGKHVIEVYAFDLEGNQSDVVAYNVNINNGNKQVASSNGNVVKTTPIDLTNNAIEGEQKLASRPTLSINSNLEVGRISDSEISASLETVKTTPIITSNGEGILSSPKINENKTSLKEPVILTNVVSSQVASNTAMKVSSLSSVSNNVSLSTPKIKNEAVEILVAKNVNNISVVSDNTLKVSAKANASSYDINTPKVKASQTGETVNVAKKVSDNSFVNNEINLAIGKTVLDTPKTVTKPIEVANNVNNVPVASNNTLKVSAKANEANYDINTPKVKVEQKTNKVDSAKVYEPVKKVVPNIESVPKAEPVKIASAKAEPKKVAPAKAEPKKVAPAKAEPKKVAPAKVAKGKAKLRNLVNEDKGTLLWDNKTKTVTAYVNNCKVELKIGSKKAYVNGNPVVVNLVPVLKNGRTIIDITDYNALFKAPALKD